MYKIFSNLPTGIYQWGDVSYGSDDWRDENTSCPVGTEYTISATVVVLANNFRRIDENPLMWAKNYAQNVFLAQKSVSILDNFSSRNKAKNAGSSSKTMREYGKEVNMRDFPHDCGMADTYCGILQQWILWVFAVTTVGRQRIFFSFLPGYINWNMNNAVN